ncbi:DNA-directed RNA polymerase II core subunit, partial [Oleoguttula sp. CCFEE 5521]
MNAPERSSAAQRSESFGDEAPDKADLTPQRKSPKKPAKFQVHGSYASRVPAVRDPKFHGSTESKQVPAYNNVPDRFELFVLGEDEKKIEYKAVTQIANAAEFTFNKEDHTLANLLRDKLFRMDQVQFVGYKVPHPLFATF